MENMEHVEHTPASSSEHESAPPHRAHNGHEVKDSLASVSPKIAFLFGLAVGVAVISTLGFLSLLSQQGDYFASGALALVPSKNAAGADPAVVAANDNPSPPPTDSAPPEPTADPSKITVTDQDHIRGDKNAPITMVEFSDFQCPFCSRFAPEAQKLLDNNPGKVRLVYKHFPLSFHPFAQKAAEASECASEQGKFWEMHDKMFSEQALFSDSYFSQAAGQLSLNQSAFDSCLSSGKYRQLVDAHYKMGEAGGVTGTPGSFINGVYVAGAKPYDSLQQIVDGLLKQ